jgi:hypothetical protein
MAHMYILFKKTIYILPFRAFDIVVPGWLAYLKLTNAENQIVLLGPYKKFSTYN